MTYFQAVTFWVSLDANKHQYLKRPIGSLSAKNTKNTWTKTFFIMNIINFLMRNNAVMTQSLIALIVLVTTS